MTDETTPDDTAPEAGSPAEDAVPEAGTPPEDTVPEAGTPAEDTVPVAAVPVAAAAGSGGGPVEAAPRKGIFVPRWLAILLGLVIAVGLVGGGGFALGRSTADDDHHEGVEDHREGPTAMPPLGDPDGGGNGGNGDDDEGDSRDPAPTRPGPTSGVYLGVAVAGANGTDGARVVEVVPGSPADDAGLEVGDVITAIDGTEVTDGAELADAIQGGSAGDEVEITYERDGSSATTTAELADRSRSGSPSTSPPA
jgi:membrane-associated protease RseP (regulator of RpoE activity)